MADLGRTLHDVYWANPVVSAQVAVVQGEAKIAQFVFCEQLTSRLQESEANKNLSQAAEETKQLFEARIHALELLVSSIVCMAHVPPLNFTARKNVDVESFLKMKRGRGKSLEFS